MKKAIVFLMVVAIFLSNIVAEINETKDGKVTFEFSSDKLEKVNMKFADAAASDMTTASAADETDYSKIITPSKDGSAVTSQTATFYFIWYVYSEKNIEVDLAVTPLTYDTDKHIKWKIEPSVVPAGDSYEGIPNTAQPQFVEFEVANANNKTIENVVTLTGNGKMHQSWGSVKLVGTATLDDSVPGDYVSTITATMTSVS